MVFYPQIFAEVSPHLNVVGNPDTEYAEEHGENRKKSAKIRANTLWLQTTILVGRDDVFDHDLIFSDNNVVN